MEWWVFIIIFFAAFLFLLAIGLPVAFAFMLVNLVFVIILMGANAGPHQMVMNMFDSISIFTIAPVPLFILLGEILFHSGMALRALDMLSRLLGKLPGRLSGPPGTRCLRTGWAGGPGSHSFYRGKDPIPCRSFASGVSGSGSGSTLRGGNPQEL